MNKRFASVVVASAGLLSLMSGTALADTAPPSPEQSCEGVKLTGTLPAPPAGMAVVQDVTIGKDCKPVTGPVQYVPASSGKAAAKGALAAAPQGAPAAAGRQFRSWNEMFDCCNIRMTGLYTTSTWSSADGRITTAATEARHEWNREPWDAGWSLKSSDKKDDCTTNCATVTTQANAEFTYKGIFDVTGKWYANTHHSNVKLNPDSTATCTFDVDLRHTFIGWNWRRGCE
ncbi:hypothetical protein AB0K89_14645 [Streptomyces cinnamoneus]|uniref:hypothetical protein n=1 Tax=Streptomyces cinnamoneus TaxID=53446 RepID=UPI003449A72D